MNRMGGHALKTVNASRLNLVTYNIVKQDLLDKLGPFMRIEYMYDVPEKIDFGDIDVLYQMSSKKDDIRNLLQSVFNPVEMVKNGPVLSFAYAINDTFYQVDMIHTTDFAASKFYFSYSDIGMIIGKILRPYGLHFGSQGLFVKHKDKQIILSSDPLEICKYLGLDYSKWLTFKSMLEIFEWIITMKLFNATHFSYKENHYDRRSVDRPMFQQFLTYINHDLCAVDPPISKEKEAIAYFLKQGELEACEKKYRENAGRREKFNGAMLMKFGFLDKGVGAALASFKEYINAPDFSEWIDNTTSYEIESCIDNWYVTYSKP